MDPFDEVPDTVPDDWSTDRKDGDTRIEVRIGGPANEVTALLRSWFGTED